MLSLGHRALLGALLTVWISAVASAAPVVYTAAGADTTSIQAAVNAFRADLGTLNPNVAGSFGSGRREINWDGVPDVFAAPNNLPANFFNVNSPRGAVFATPGSGFQVSSNAVNPTSTPVEFGNLNPTYPSLFATFSPQRLFTALDSNITDVNFFVSGSTTPAVVSGFGAVFTDVDLPNSTSIEFFDASNNLLSTVFAPAASGNQTLSFVGVRFTEGSIVSSVRITSGNSALGATFNDTPGTDLVTMDDFIYAEPVAAPANVVPLPPAAWAGLASALLAWRRMRRA